MKTINNEETSEGEVECVNKKLNYKILSLFAGIGGIDLGFITAKHSKLSYEIICATDHDLNCINTYNTIIRKNKPSFILSDIQKLDINTLPSFDILTGGFPCQAFSIAGNRLGFKDKKIGGNLFFCIAKILEIKKPIAFLLENVKNLETHDNKKTFKIITETLEKIGYHIKFKVLNTMKYGNIPQNRERIFIVGFLNKTSFDNFSFPKEIPLKKNFKEYLESKVDDKYYYREDKLLYEKIKNYITSEDTVYQWRRKYVRVNKKGVIPTLTANMGSGGHNVPIIKDLHGIRKLTPKECFLFQGFPKNITLPTNLSDSILYHQAGNSVSVPVVKRIAKNILKVL